MTYYKKRQASISSLISQAHSSIHEIVVIILLRANDSHVDLTYLPSLLCLDIYQILIDENVTAGSVIYDEIKASDADLGMDGTFYYSFLTVSYIWAVISE